MSMHSPTICTTEKTTELMENRLFLEQTHQEKNQRVIFKISAKVSY